MANNLKAGDVVTLKSGGPKMTVEWIDEEINTVNCSWFDNKGAIQEKSFSPESLKVEES